MLRWLFSNFYDKIMRDAEDKGLRNWRETLMKNISGEVLELGCGTGANIDFYPSDISRLVLVEPCSHMRQKLKAKLANYSFSDVKILSNKAESLTLNDASFDVVVCTLVLCSVRNLEKTLAELHRILRPQGRLIFIEHVAAANNPKRYQWQNRLNFLWRHIAGGCHLTRFTEEAIIQAGFKIEEISRQSMRGVPPVVRPSIRGVATRG